MKWSFSIKLARASKNALFRRSEFLRRGARSGAGSSDQLLGTGGGYRRGDIYKERWKIELLLGPKIQVLRERYLNETTTGH
jgi:hypothetical protein